MEEVEIEMPIVARMLHPRQQRRPKMPDKILSLVSFCAARNTSARFGFAHATEIHESVVLSTGGGTGPLTFFGVIQNKVCVMLGIVAYRISRLRRLPIPSNIHVLEGA